MSNFSFHVSKSICARCGMALSTAITFENRRYCSWKCVDLKHVGPK